MACDGTIPCLPDLNGDSVVDSADLSELLAEWGPCEGDSFGGDPFLEWALQATIEELMQWLQEHPNG